jgi:hypothetical protein
MMAFQQEQEAYKRRIKVLACKGKKQDSISKIISKHRGPVLTTKPFHGRVPTALSMKRNPVPPLSVNVPLCGYQETHFLRGKKAQCFP